MSLPINDTRVHLRIKHVTRMNTLPLAYPQHFQTASSDPITPPASQPAPHAGEHFSPPMQANSNNMQSKRSRNAICYFNSPDACMQSACTPHIHLKRALCFKRALAGGKWALALVGQAARAVDPSHGVLGVGWCYPSFLLLISSTTVPVRLRKTYLLG